MFVCTKNTIKVIDGNQMQNGTCLQIGETYRKLINKWLSYFNFKNSLTTLHYI
jgi:hypothetical protein